MLWKHGVVEMSETDWDMLDYGNLDHMSRHDLEDAVRESWTIIEKLRRYERNHEELWDIILKFSPKDSEEDDDIHEQWLESVSQGYMGSVYDYIMMKREEAI